MDVEKETLTYKSSVSLMRRSSQKKNKDLKFKPIYLTSPFFLFVSQISQTNVEIEKLQSALRENNRQEADISLLADKQCQAHIKSAKMKHTSIQQEIDQLNSQLNSLTLEDGQAERVIQEVSLMYLTFHSKCTNTFNFH